ncbi:MAG: hypothetical protein AVDCRST_MAG45-2590 [uncultured Solirubrobacterales bacterium]|uniref:Uncharacterized protein n=1 Tax=uncultured Solirubrobacterales bacterium TaxID=768556 RepID=A0A6J4TH93_9ACTN|nr:MAG: hypothetical protein AVDCRST_MAG45-2590 [uncultured Solirubrobacterales bacterium]
MTGVDRLPRVLGAGAQPSQRTIAERAARRLAASPPAPRPGADPHDRGIALALATSEISGTGASNVGSSAERTAQPAPEPSASGSRADAGAQIPARRECEPTGSNPGGDNNSHPRRPRGPLARRRLRDHRPRALGLGLQPLAGVPIQVWLATETGAETDNRATVRTGEDGRYRIETAPRSRSSASPTSTSPTTASGSSRSSSVGSSTRRRACDGQSHAERRWLTPRAHLLPALGRARAGSRPPSPWRRSQRCPSSSRLPTSTCPRRPRRSSSRPARARSRSRPWRCSRSSPHAPVPGAAAPVGAACAGIACSGPWCWDWSSPTWARCSSWRSTTPSSRCHRTGRRAPGWRSSR